MRTASLTLLGADQSFKQEYKYVLQYVLLLILSYHSLFCKYCVRLVTGTACRRAKDSKTGWMFQPDSPSGTASRVWSVKATCSAAKGLTHVIKSESKIYSCWLSDSWILTCLCGWQEYLWGLPCGDVFVLLGLPRNFCLVLYGICSLFCTYR